MSIYNDAKGAVLEKMDIELFLEHVDCMWRDHYAGAGGDMHIVFDNVTEHMSPAEIEAAIKDSGCMDDYIPVHLRNQAN
jgi:hypothetical protein